MKTLFIQSAAGSSATTGYIAIIIYLAIAFGIFMILRSLWLWYFKINKHIELMEDLKAYQIFELSKKYPGEFKQYNDNWNQFKNSQVGKMADPRKL